MAVKRYAAVNIAALALSAHPVHFICDTFAELPSSGLKLGDTAIVLTGAQANLEYKAASASTWVLRTVDTATTPTEFVVKTADESVTSSTTLQNDNHLFFAMAANEVWMVTGTYFLASASGTPGFKCGLAVPAGATAVWDTPTNWGAPAGGSIGIGLTAASTFSISVTTTGTNPITLKYRVVNGGTAGNFQLTWAQNGSNATATSLLRYSTLAALRVA
jgi:predicted secreted protein